MNRTKYITPQELFLYIPEPPEPRVTIERLIYAERKAKRKKKFIEWRKKR